MAVDLRKQSRSAYISVGIAASIILLLPYRAIMGCTRKVHSNVTCGYRGCRLREIAGEYYVNDVIRRGRSQYGNFTLCKLQISNFSTLNYFLKLFNYFVSTSGVHNKGRYESDVN
jgi:hypothetical protein